MNDLEELESVVSFLETREKELTLELEYRIRDLEELQADHEYLEDQVKELTETVNFFLDRVSIGSFKKKLERV